MHEYTPYSFEPRWHPGLGQAPQTLETESAEGGQVGSAVGAAIGTAVGGPVLGAVVGSAITAATQLVVAAEKLFSGCGQTCTEATQIVNQVEPLLMQNNQQYFTNPNRTTGDQQLALSIFEQIWATVTQNCGNPALGAAGQNCINARGPNATGCDWGLTTANEYPPYSSVPYPVGVCWNWFLAYYDPILNDVPPGGTGAVTGATSSTTSSTSTSSMLPLLLGVAAMAVLLMVIE